MKEAISSGTILFNQNNGVRRYLLLNYPTGHWDFIKGGIERDKKARQEKRYDKAMKTKGSPERKAEAQHLRNVRFNMQGRGPTPKSDSPKDAKRKKLQSI